MNDHIQRAMELVDGLQGYSREVRDYLDKLDGRYVRPAQQPRWPFVCFDSSTAHTERLSVEMLMRTCRLE